MKLQKVINLLYTYFSSIIPSYLTWLLQLDEELLSRLLAERDKVLVAADNASMKEVKGVENRLYGLEQLIVNASKIVKDQEAYAQVN